MFGPQAQEGLSHKRQFHCAFPRKRRFDIHVLSHAEISLRFLINVTIASAGFEPISRASKTRVLPVRRQGKNVGES